MFYNRDDFEKSLKITGIIAARSGSKGVPNKHTTLLCGKPVIAYTLEAALNAKSLDRIVVSTNGKEIADIANRYGVTVIMRPEELSDDNAPIEAAYRHAAKVLKETEQYEPDIIVQLYANVPVRKDGDIDLAVEKLIKTKADSVMTVYRPRTHPDVMKILQNGFLVSYTNSQAITRQQFETVFAPNGSIIATWAEILLRSLPGNDRHEFMGTKILPFEQDPIYSVEIDSPHDFILSELFLEYIEKTNSTNN